MNIVWFFGVLFRFVFVSVEFSIIWLVSPTILSYGFVVWFAGCTLVRALNLMKAGRGVGKI